MSACSACSNFIPPSYTSPSASTVTPAAAQAIQDYAQTPDSVQLSTQLTEFLSTLGQTPDTTSSDALTQAVAAQYLTPAAAAYNSVGQSLSDSGSDSAPAPASTVNVAA